MPDFSQMKPLPFLKLEGTGPFTFIGDIHGCADELSDLIDLVKNKFPSTQIISLGDVCDRGPNVHGCIQLLKGCSAKIVMGNHDDKILRFREGRPVKIRLGQQKSLDSMVEEDFTWLKDNAIPIIRCPDLNIAAIHGGVFPGT